MEPNKCKICGERHWSQVCNQNLKSPPPKHRLVKTAEEAAAIAKAPFDRKAYQREYMKKYMAQKRAKDKAEKEKSSG